MSLVILAIAAAVVILAVVVMLVLVYRVLKAAHTRPAPAPEQAHDGASHAHSNTGNGHGALDTLVMNVVTKTIRFMLRLGLRLGPMMMLTVPGRKTGLPRTNPVDLFERDGEHWLVATHDANASWVRNLRAARHGTLALGRRSYGFIAVELSQQDAGAVLKDVLGPRLARPVAGFVLRQTIAVPSDAPREMFVKAAAIHPVFQISIRRDGPRLTATTHPAEKENSKP
jgi:deazaflavin-dependent oxidoreductase (nitroreductase family)